MHIQDKESSILCTSNTKIHSGKNVLEASFSFNLSSGKGFVNINGFILDSDKNKTNVNIKKNFSFYKKGTGFIFEQAKSNVFDVSADEAKLLSQFLPDFFIKKTPLYYYVNIEKINSGAWVFSTSRTPYFICIDY
ncbi:hypothetical protein ACMYSN_17905 [Klebsiella sp. R445]